MMTYPENRNNDGALEEKANRMGPDRPRVRTYSANDIRVRRPAQQDGRSLGDLFSELTHETQTLVRQEIELARTEATEKAKRAGKNAGVVAAGGFVAYAGLIVLLMGAAFLLALIMPLWLAAVIVGAAVMLVGYAFVNKGLTGLKHTDFKLERTAVTIREDKQWIREEI